MSEVSLTIDVGNHIRTYILSGEIQPGERLNVDGLARKMNISKTPIREALQMLAAERLVVYRPKLGYSVQQLTPREFIETTEIQYALEKHILLKIVESKETIDFEIPRRINRDIERAIRKKEKVRMFSLNEAFHIAIYQHCGNKKILEELKRLWNELIIHRYGMFSSQNFICHIVEDHNRMIGALASGDAAEVTAAIRMHFEHGTLGATEICRPEER